MTLKEILQNIIGSRNEAVSEKDTTIANLQSELANANVLIASLNAQVQELAEAKAFLAEQGF